MNCSNCNREINMNDAFCGGCGSKLNVSPATDSNTCPACMNEMLPTQTNCKKCGSNARTLPDKETSQDSNVSSKGSNLPGLIFSGIGLAIIFFAYLTFESTGTTLITDNNPGIGLQHVMMVPLGIIGAIVVIAGMYFLRDSSNDK